MKIISICPSNTELLAYLGLIDQLIAVDDFSDWPSAVHSLPKLGPDLSIDIDKLVSFKPDLVLASLSVPGMEKNVEELKKRNIRHIVLDPQSLDDIANDLLIVGVACQIEERALQVKDEFTRFISEMKKRATTVNHKPTLYWEWWPKPIFTPGNINWLTEISSIAGGLNEFRDVDQANVQTDWEDVKERNPDYILLAWVGVQTTKINKEVVLRRPGWQSLSAIQNDNFPIMEESLYCRPSPRLLEGALQLAKMIHPTVYNDLELPLWVQQK